MLDCPRRFCGLPGFSWFGRILMWSNTGRSTLWISSVMSPPCLSQADDEPGDSGDLNLRNVGASLNSQVNQVPSDQGVGNHFALLVIMALVNGFSQ
jgi:hypothetical protein